MKIPPRSRARLSALAAFSCIQLCLLTPAHGQTANPLVRNAETAQIAAGWTAVEAGRVAEAVKAADAILKRKPAHHAALTLKIEALARTQPLRSLDAYEQWLTLGRSEDIDLLTIIAIGTLVDVAVNDRSLEAQALKRLADTGDDAALDRLRALREDATSGVDVALALAGDAAAAGRLLKGEPALPPQTLARALSAAGIAAAPRLRELLQHPAAPVRGAAALELGKIGATDAIADLKPLMNDPVVRSFAAVALTRLGEAEAEPAVLELLQSPVHDVRLLGAEAYVGRGSGPWVEALMPALADPNGLTRIRAAELLAKVAPDAARQTLLEAASDPNPVTRADVGRVFEATGLASPSTPDQDTPVGGFDAHSLVALRRMLRDPDGSIRLYAAGAVLRAAKGPANR